MTASAYTMDGGRRPEELERLPFVTILATLPQTVVPPPHIREPNPALGQTRTVIFAVRPDTYPLPAWTRHTLRASGRQWIYETGWYRPRSDAEWDYWAQGAGADTSRERGISPVVGVDSNLDGMAWHAADLAHRGIVWHLTQDLAPEAWWPERWAALGVPRGRLPYIVRNFGRQLGLV